MSTSHEVTVIQFVRLIYILFFLVHVCIYIYYSRRIGSDGLRTSAKAPAAMAPASPRCCLCLCSFSSFLYSSYSFSPVDTTSVTVASVYSADSPYPPAASCSSSFLWWNRWWWWCFSSAMDNETS
uniref:Uncharacterized protein n=1 Tax=Zea mays TaxID=4577 RepID=C0P4Z0_MAIZE|nr:unknown [Zea mays]